MSCSHFAPPHQPPGSLRLEKVQYPWLWREGETHIKELAKGIMDSSLSQQCQKLTDRWPASQFPAQQCQFQMRVSCERKCHSEWKFHTKKIILCLTHQKETDNRLNGLQDIRVLSTNHWWFHLVRMTPYWQVCPKVVFYFKSHFTSFLLHIWIFQCHGLYTALPLTFYERKWTEGNLEFLT